MTTQRTEFGREIETALGEVLNHVRGETDLPCRIVTLAREDATRFFDALSDPPPPNDRLRAALEEHARRVDSR